MPFSLLLPDGYGYVVAIALGVIPVLAFGHGTIVGPKRKAAGIPYPNAYATPDQVKNSKAAYTFNCAQRAHGQLLENMPQTIFMMLFAGLFYPTATQALGALWVAFRILFAYGYIYSDKPNGSGRLIGSASWLAQGALWGLSLYAALTVLP